jgi:hypothetical protein
MTAESRTRIIDLLELVAALPDDDRARFQRIFHVGTTVGRLNPPEAMHPWIESYFGSVDAVRSQRIVKVTNLVTMEGALFNELRARRPIEVRSPVDVVKTVMEKVGDPFCTPLAGTPEDVFGRIEGKYSITASNIAKYDGFHGLVIFDEHDPLVFTAERIADYLDTAWRWAQQAHALDPEARYFFFMWNCLWKAAASILHGHAQMTLTRDMHYARVEALRRAALSYCQQYGANYFDDLYAAHAALGLAFEARGARVISYLTPVKERETLIITDGFNGALKDGVYRSLSCFNEQLTVTSFNVAIYQPPIAPAPEDWSGFPVIARIVDRGDPMVNTGDIGAMELYASNVIGTDPFFVADLLRGAFA